MRIYVSGILLLICLNCVGQNVSTKNGVAPPTTEEMAPLRPEYLAELKKVHEPPEITMKPMTQRVAPPASAVKIFNAMSTFPSPDKATHEQRTKAIQALVTAVGDLDPADAKHRDMAFELIAQIACYDGAPPTTIIGYLNNVSAVSSESLALRARMYQRQNDKKRALDDLEQIMLNGSGHVLTSGETDPRKVTSSCGWSVDDFDAMSDDPRSLAAKAFYLNTYVTFGASERGTASESVIKDLYSRSASLWHSPIPHYLVTKMGGLGSGVM
jgi:hypothetical protein